MAIIAEESEDTVKEQQSTSDDRDRSIEVNQTHKSEGANVNHEEEDSDGGFETASERDVSDRDDDDDVSKQQPQQYSDSLQSDDELKQKALVEANEAKLQGNKLFGEGKYEEASQQYEHALQVAPDMSESTELRSICHSNRGVCFLKLGKYEDTIKECTKALELNPTYVKALIRRGEAHEKLEHFEEALTGMKKILELDPSNEQAKKSIRRLEPLAAEKREKMKEEMIGKLKEMGNSLLGRFGMSVDNFKAVKDPNTGSYSISFQQ
jgi:tetratricopeptide (TPR) repeat protein